MFKNSFKVSNTNFKAILIGVALIVASGFASASPMDIHFTASGSATGSGDAIFDSSFLAPNAFHCCSAPPSQFESLNLNLDFGSGITTFTLADLGTPSYYVLNIGSNGAVNDINFWGTNAAGVHLTGISPFHDAASGALGANGTVVYTVNSVTAVPEPMSVALLGLGLVGLVASRRKAARKA